FYHCHLFLQVGLIYRLIKSGAGPQEGALYMSNETKSEAKKEIGIDLTYRGYVFLGWASGMFELKNGEKRPYYALWKNNMKFPLHL
ncbi:MAG: hypothetical protein K2L38_13635, partial [Dysosmobacter sp.]|nr:hypothetical protein [Dysosmobacter sp.]